ncbi:MAG TPA: hypothetical protein VF517_04335 [Thermoleophilaceae bacterium]|jgi:hypothetical protein
MARSWPAAAAAIATVLAAFAAPPSPAGAAPRDVSTFVPSYAEPYASESNSFYSWSGPVLAGGSAAWARSRPQGGWVVERAAPGQPVTRLATSERPTIGSRVIHTVRPAGGSASRVAWTDTAFDVLDAHGMSYRSIRSRLYATGAGGASIVTGCGDGPSECRCPQFCSNFSYAADLDGDVLAYVEGNYPHRTIVVDDLASADAPVRIEVGGDAGDHIRIAGDHVAYVGFSNLGSHTVV